MPPRQKAQTSSGDSLPVCRIVVCTAAFPVWQEDLREPPALDVVAHLARRDATFDRLVQHVQLWFERVPRDHGAGGRQGEVVERQGADDLGAELADPEAGEELADLLDRVVVLHHPPPLPLRCSRDALLEQSEQQVVLARERLVEAPQRQLRPVDDVLDREVEPARRR